MARTVGPLMSLEASGQLAGTIVYSKWKGRPYVRQLVTPSNPRSVLQVSTRAMMKFLSQAWTPDIDATEQATWEAAGAASATSPFNEYIRDNLKRWTQFTAPSQASPATGGGTSPTFTSLPAVTGGVRQASFAWTVNALGTGWGLMIFQSKTTGFTTARDNLVSTVELPAGASSAILTPVEPGTYFWNFRTFTVEGKLSAALGQVTAVVS